jgi:hypothetical protein
MAATLTESQARVLVEIDDAQSCVVVNQGSAARLLAAGEYIKCLPDTPLRLLAFGFLDSDGNGRLTPTRTGQQAADLFRDSRKLWRETET